MDRVGAIPMRLQSNLIRIIRVEESQNLLPTPYSLLPTTCSLLPASYRQTLTMSLSTAAAVGRAPFSSMMAVMVPIVSV